MSFYDFTVEEYAEFLEKELAGTNIVTLNLGMMGKRGRKPKQAAINTASPKPAEQSPVDMLPALKSGIAPHSNTESDVTVPLKTAPVSDGLFTLTCPQYKLTLVRSLSSVNLY